MLFIAYVGFLIYFLLLSDVYGRTGIRTEYAYNLELFKEITRFWQYRDVLGTWVVAMNLVGNVAIFMPFGFIIAMAGNHRSFIRATAYTLLFSLCIETVQLVTKIGSFDVDDLLLNTIGGCIGFIVFSICCMIRRRYVTKKTKKRR
ncbi:MAG: VanZ family protein [Eubacteriales bacterium]